MKIIDRYIAKTLLFYTLGVASVWVSVYALFNFINEVNLIGQGQYDIVSALIYVGVDLPSVVYAHSSVIILLGCLLGLGHLAATSQLIVIRGCGLSILQIARKSTLLALLLMLFIMLIGEFVAPVATEYAESYKNKALGYTKSISKIALPGFWVKDGSTIINVKKNLDGRNFADVTLIRLNKNNRLDSILYADKATFNEGSLQLEGGKKYQLNKAEKFTNIAVNNYKHHNIKVAFKQNSLLNIKKKPEQLTSWGLYQQIVFLNKNGLEAKYFEVEFYKRVTKPLTLAAMLLLAMLFIFGSLRDATLGKKIFLGVIISLFFELSSRIGSAVSLRFNYDPLLSAAVPSVIALIIALILLRKKSIG